MDDLYDEKAAARVAGVHPRTVRRRRGAGLLAFYRTPTGRIRYRLDDLIAATTIERVPASGRMCPPLAARAPFQSALSIRDDEDTMKTLTRNTPAPATQQRGTPPPARGARSASIALTTYNATARTVEAVFSAGSRVQRWGMVEELEVSATAIDLARVAAGLCPLLNAHNQENVDAVLGTVVCASIRNGQLVGTVRFADTEAGREAERRVAAGELPGLSIGYAVRAWKLVESTDDRDVWRATEWELMEVSLVPIPADPAAGFRAAPGIVTPSQEETTDVLHRNHPGGSPTPPPSVPTIVTARDITAAARNAGLDIVAVDDMLARHEGAPMTRETMMREIGIRYAQRDSGASTVNRVSPTGHMGDGRNGMASRMADALFARMSGTAPLEHAREFMGVG